MQPGKLTMELVLTRLQPLLLRLKAVLLGMELVGVRLGSGSDRLGNGSDRLEPVLLLLMLVVRGLCGKSYSFLYEMYQWGQATTRQTTTNVVRQEFKAAANKQLLRSYYNRCLRCGKSYSYSIKKERGQLLLGGIAVRQIRMQPLQTSLNQGSERMQQGHPSLISVPLRTKPRSQRTESN